MLAIAAAVTVLGFTLGRPLDIPDCPRSDLTHEAVVTATCKEAAGSSTKLWRSWTVRFPVGNAPEIGRPTISIKTVDDNVISIGLQTFGLDDQDRVLRSLVAKFGQPMKIERPPLQTLGGASAAGVLAKWQSPEMNVIFGSALDRIDRGFVEIDTPNAKIMFDADAKNEAAKHTPL